VEQKSGFLIDGADWLSFDLFANKSPPCEKKKPFFICFSFYTVNNLRIKTKNTKN
jgi:hypothetical protein